MPRHDGYVRCWPSADIPDHKLNVRSGRGTEGDQGSADWLTAERNQCTFGWLAYSAAATDCTMDVSNIVRMANQITDFFAVYPKQEALDGIAKHIHATWEPRLRNTLKEHLDTGGAGLKPLCIEAMNGYFRGPKSPNARRVDPTRSDAPTGGEPSFADEGGDGG